MYSLDDYDTLTDEGEPQNLIEAIDTKRELDVWTASFSIRKISIEKQVGVFKLKFEER